MDGFVALLTEKFHESDWTDQEVGVALARGVPIVAVRLGKDPYGFIGKFQGLSCSWENCDVELVKLLIKYDRMFGAYARALRKVTRFDVGNRLGEIMPSITHLNSNQIDELVASYNETSGLRRSFAFNGKYDYAYGNGLVAHLNRLGSRRFVFGSKGIVESAP